MELDPCLQQIENDKIGSDLYAPIIHIYEVLMHSVKLIYGIREKIFCILQFYQLKTMVKYLKTHASYIGNPFGVISMLSWTILLCPEIIRSSSHDSKTFSATLYAFLPPLSPVM